MKSLFLTFLLVLVSLLAACAGVPFQPGVSSGDDVLRQWGAPAQRWSEPDGSQRLAYPWGPMGFATWMVEVGPDGKVRSATNVLVEEEFAKVQAGQTQEEILRHFGRPGWVQEFERRQELVWEWRFCDQWTYPARFNVLFDSTTGLVRSTLQIRESLGRHHEICAR